MDSSLPHDVYAHGAKVAADTGNWAIFVLIAIAPHFGKILRFLNVFRVFRITTSYDMVEEIKNNTETNAKAISELVANVSGIKNDMASNREKHVEEHKWVRDQLLGIGSRQTKIETRCDMIHGDIRDVGRFDHHPFAKTKGA